MQYPIRSVSMPGDEVQNIAAATEASAKLGDTILKGLGMALNHVFEFDVKQIDRVSTAKANARAREITAEAEAWANAAIVLKDLDNELIQRTGQRVLIQSVKRQENIEKTLLLTDEDLRDSSQPISEIPVDEDWAVKFFNIAQDVSNEEMQLLFAKILSGEIRNPGSFSARTVQALSLLDTTTANIFRKFCDITIEVTPVADLLTAVLWEPFGPPGTNGLAPVGLSYLQLTQLQDAGLIQHDLSAYREIPLPILTFPCKIGDQPFQFHFDGDAQYGNVRLKVLHFTKIGLELRKVTNFSSDPVYNTKFIEWIKTKFNLI